MDYKYGHHKWHGIPVKEATRYPGTWKEKVRLYKYNSLEEARSMVSDSMKSAYQIRIFKITNKS